MIDTIRLEIRGLTTQEVSQVKSLLESHLIADNATGAIRSEIINKNIQKMKVIRDSFMDGPEEQCGWCWIFDDIIRELSVIPAGSEYE